MTAVLTRRAALGAGAVVLGAGLVAGTAPAVASTAVAAPSSPAATPATASAPAVELTRSLFSGREGVSFTGLSPFGAHTLVLDEVADLTGGGDAEQRFRVLFTADAATRDGIYRLMHGVDLVATLFLARVGGGAVLEGIIDRGRTA